MSRYLVSSSRYLYIVVGGYRRILCAPSVQSCRTLWISASNRVFVYGRYRKYRLCVCLSDLDCLDITRFYEDCPRNGKSGCVEGIRRALFLGLVLIAVTAIEQAPSVVPQPCYHHHSCRTYATKTAFISSSAAILHAFRCSASDVYMLVSISILFRFLLIVFLYRRREHPLCLRPCCNCE